MSLRLSLCLSLRPPQCSIRAPTGRISTKFVLGNFLKTSQCTLRLVNIGSLMVIEMRFIVIDEQVIAVTGLDASEMQLGCYDSLIGTNIMRKQDNVILYVLCLSYPVSDLLLHTVTTGLRCYDLTGPVSMMSQSAGSKTQICFAVSSSVPFDC